MVLTRSLETASTGRFLTIFYFGFFWPEPEPLEPKPAEPDIVTEPSEQNIVTVEPEPA